MLSTNKTTVIFRISQEDKAAFYNMCDMRALNPSGVIRRMIEKFCIAHYKEAAHVKEQRQQMK